MLTCTSNRAQFPHCSTAAGATFPVRALLPTDDALPTTPARLGLDALGRPICANTGKKNYALDTTHGPPPPPPAPACTAENTAAQLLPRVLVPEVRGRGKGKEG